MTGFPVNADKVTGVMNSLPAGVITTCTSAPFFINARTKYAALYAAILPVIPNMIFFPFIPNSKAFFISNRPYMTDTWASQPLSSKGYKA